MAAAKNIEENSVEFMIMNVKTETMLGGKMSLSYNQNQLSYLNIMVSDTGSTCESTEWNKGMINIKSAGAELKITAENGEETSPTKIFDLPVTQHDKNGQEVQRIVLQYVTCIPPWFVQPVQWNS